MSLKGMVFNNIRKPQILLLEGRRKSPYFPVNRQIVRYARGYRIKKTEKGLLEIQQSIGYVVEDDVDALAIRDDLTSWLITEDWAPLQFDDEPGRTYWAVVQNDMSDFERFAQLRYGTIQFVAKSAEGAMHTFNITTTFQTFTIAGQEKTPWRSKTTFSAPADQFVLETNTGGKIILNYDFIAGDVLEIDYETRDVWLNGEDLAISIALETVWFELEPGFMLMRASHETELKYTERYY